MRFVFWQNILSPHQAPYLRALAHGGHEVTIVTTEAMTEDRRALGWKLPDHGKTRIRVAPTKAEVRNLIAGGDQAVIHVMAGARWTPLGNLAAMLCRVNGKRMGILSEAPDPRGFLGYGRRAKYACEQFSRGSYYEFVLAMGEQGVRWFRQCGHPAPKVFPFAYVTDVTKALIENDTASEFSMLYCGQFIPRKGLDILLRAFASMPSKLTQLRLLGDGPAQRQLQNDAQSLGIEGRISWLAKRSPSEAQVEMGKADITVLPSHHDGWGAVVNESLMAGTPVICSTACGAAELIRQPWLGSVFQSGSVAALAQALKAWMDRGPRSAAERERIRQWSACINGESVARYFSDVMEHVYAKTPRPEAPWRIK